MKLTNNLRLLSFINESQGQMNVEDYNLSYHVYLMTAKKIGFSYAFRFDPEPYSSGLSDDIDILVDSEFITHNSPYQITGRGKGRIAEAEPLLSEITPKIKGYVNTAKKWSRSDLFHQVYELAVS
jgi:uncharacterized protein YwgA